MLVEEVGVTGIGPETVGDESSFDGCLYLWRETVERVGLSEALRFLEGPLLVICHCLEREVDDECEREREVWGGEACEGGVGVPREEDTREVLEGVEGDSLCSEEGGLGERHAEEVEEVVRDGMEGAGEVGPAMVFSSPVGEQAASEGGLVEPDGPGELEEEEERRAWAGSGLGEQEQGREERGEDRPEAVDEDRLEVCAHGRRQVPVRS